MAYVVHLIPCPTRRPRRAWKSLTDMWADRCTGGKWIPGRVKGHRGDVNAASAGVDEEISILVGAFSKVPSWGLHLHTSNIHSDHLFPCWSPINQLPERKTPRQALSSWVRGEPTWQGWATEAPLFQNYCQYEPLNWPLHMGGGFFSERSIHTHQYVLITFTQGVIKGKVNSPQLLGLNTLCRMDKKHSSVVQTRMATESSFATLDPPLLFSPFTI